MPPKGGIETPVGRGLIERVKGTVSAIATGTRYTIQGVANAWMSPRNPLTPVAQQAQGRQFNYRVGYNINKTPKFDSGVSFDQLIALSESCDVVRILIEDRKDQMESLKWDIKPAPDGKATNDDPRIPLIKAFFKKPDGRTEWKQWLRQIIEEMLVTDAVSIYRRKTKGGAPFAFELIDGSTITVKINEDGRIPEAPDVAYQQVLQGIQAVDYSTEELLYYPRNLRVRHVYGYSPVEQILITINIALRRTAHQLAYYTDGNIPDALIGTPKDWTPKQVQEFQDYWDLTYQGNIEQRRKGVFVPGDAKNIHEIVQPPMKDLYDEWIARIACFAFKVSPQAFVAQMNRATAETAHDTAQDAGTIPTKEYIRALMNRLLADDFKSPDLEFDWVEDESPDPKEEQEILIGYASKAGMTLNEVRARIGLEPDPGPNANRLGIITASGWVPLDETPEEKKARLAGGGLDENGDKIPEDPKPGDDPKGKDDKGGVKKLQKKKIPLYP